MPQQERVLDQLQQSAVGRGLGQRDRRAERDEGAEAAVDHQDAEGEEGEVLPQREQVLRGGRGACRCREVIWGCGLFGVFVFVGES